MADAASLLLNGFLAWVAERPRTYAEAMEAWRTSCPRLPIWEDAVDGRFITLADGTVRLTEAGRRRTARADADAV